MSKYKVRIRKSPGWNNFDCCLVSISQGQACHEGEKLDALLSWAGENFKDCILNISDTLHRHNLIHEGLEENEATAAAFDLSRAWQERNSDILQRHLPRFQRIHRWNDWLHHVDFETTHRAVKNFFAQNSAFRDAAQRDIRAFVERKDAQAKAVSLEKLIESSTAYLMEETAAYIIMSRLYRSNRVYPAKPLETFEYLRREKDIPSILKGMEYSMCTQVSFKRMGDTADLPQAA